MAISGHHQWHSAASRARFDSLTAADSPKALRVCEASAPLHAAEELARNLGRKRLEVEREHQQAVRAHGRVDRIALRKGRKEEV